MGKKKKKTNPDAGEDWRQEEKGMTEYEMVGWHHWLNGHEFVEALAVGDRQGNLACFSPWGFRIGHNWAIELNCWRFPTKLKIELSNRVINSIAEYLSKRIRYILTPMFIASLFTRTKRRKQSLCTPTYEWIKKLRYIDKIHIKWNIIWLYFFFFCIADIY